MSLTTRIEEISKRDKAKARKRLYGTDEVTLRLMLDEQNGQCAICGHSLILRFDVDHDHETKRVRGLLCPNCNLGLGYFKDSIKNLEAAIAYLKR